MAAERILTTHTGSLPRHADIVAELVAQAEGPVDTVLVPVGGGGLVAGLALWLRAHAPGVHIVGVEPAGAPSMRAAPISSGSTSLAPS